MVKMKIKIDDDANKLKYISLIRGKSSHSISEIKKRIDDSDYVLEYDYFDTDELKVLKEIMDKLIKVGATVHLFQEDREVPIDYIDNLIGSYEEIAHEREIMDDKILGEDD
ncbi:hypothetical protein H9I32_01610 [Bacillus sp. Xin]|nr:hypothetical protein [Bacillus sp. Xin]NSW38149.1 hypothetical protein [Bacillus sp. Xin1]